MAENPAGASAMTFIHRNILPVVASLQRWEPWAWPKSRQKPAKNEAEAIAACRNQARNQQPMKQTFRNLTISLALG
jgi:hypothetical protein